MFSIDFKTTSIIISTFEKSRKRKVKRFFMPITAPGHIVSYLIILIFFVGGCSSWGSKKTTPLNNTEEMAALQNTLAQQEELLDRLQALTADQLLRSYEIEQSMPPRDLLESLQKGFIELQKKTLILEKQLSELKKGLETSGSKEKPSKSSANNFSINQEKIILGLVSLQSGNPDQAVEHLQDILKAKKATKLKGDILMAIGNGFLAQGHSKQAASHYGLFLREYPKSRHTPQALYYLGQAMKDLGEVEKQKILWKELIKNYPQSSLAKRAKKRL